MHLVRWAATVFAVLAVCSNEAQTQQRADSAARRQQLVLDSLTASLRALQNRVDSLELLRGENAPAPEPAAPVRAGSYMNMGFDGLSDFGWSTEPNVLALQPGDHDPHVRGFTIPNAELTIDATVDPYFKAFAAIVHKLDDHGETGVELEEAYFITTSLPHNLQVKGGQFLTEFGRQNAQHPHAWAFVDMPLALNRVFGPDGLRGQGARISWLVPTSFYTEIMLGVLNSAGGTAFSFRSDAAPDIAGGVPVERPVAGLSDLVFAPRITSSVDLTDTQTLLFGVSGAFGPNNTADRSRTQIYGADLYYKWKPTVAPAGFPFVSWQSEAVYRSYEAGARTSVADATITLPSETLRDRGVYSQVLWGIKPRIVAGLRGDIALGDPAAFDSELRADRHRVSTNLSWYPSEFSKLRLQYNYDRREGLGDDHSLWLQVEFILGAHAAHKF
jgi:hypothetical protein